MGTPPIACLSLQALHELSECNVVGVVTQPDRPSGRGKKHDTSAVKKLASQLGLNVLQPEKLNDEPIRDELISMNVDLIVVMAYGQILPDYILDIPKFGAVNIHASLLPRHLSSSLQRISLPWGKGVVAIPRHQ